MSRTQRAFINKDLKIETFASKDKIQALEYLFDLINKDKEYEQFKSYVVKKLNQFNKEFSLLKKMPEEMWGIRERIRELYLKDTQQLLLERKTSSNDEKLIKVVDLLLNILSTKFKNLL